MRLPDSVVHLIYDLNRRAVMNLTTNRLEVKTDIN
jgi:hypothetical protein